jgi:predicted HicB family RNase H-like nuclease
MAKKAKTKPFNVLLEPSLRKRAQAAARKQDMSVGQLMRRALERELARIEGEGVGDGAPR